MVVCINSGPLIWCVYSYLACGVALCRSGMRRKKPARRSITTVKALSMGSNLFFVEDCFRIFEALTQVTDETVR